MLRHPASFNGEQEDIEQEALKWYMKSADVASSHWKQYSILLRLQPESSINFTTMSLKPILLHGHVGGPNPWKVVLLLKELNLPYEHKFWDFGDLKKPEYEKLCVNGRTPTIEDPNTGIILWESGAILEYLVDLYDKEKENFI